MLDLEKMKYTVSELSLHGERAPGWLICCSDWVCHVGNASSLSESSEVLLFTLLLKHEGVAALLGRPTNYTRHPGPSLKGPRTPNRMKAH